MIRLQAIAATFAAMALATTAHAMSFTNTVAEVSGSATLDPDGSPATDSFDIAQPPATLPLSGEARSREEDVGDAFGFATAEAGFLSATTETVATSEKSIADAGAEFSGDFAGTGPMRLQLDIEKVVTTSGSGLDLNASVMVVVTAGSTLLNESFPLTGTKDHAQTILRDFTVPAQATGTIQVTLSSDATSDVGSQATSLVSSKFQFVPEPNATPRWFASLVALGLLRAQQRAQQKARTSRAA